jgi:hypothetical protein
MLLVEDYLAQAVHIVDVDTIFVILYLLLQLFLLVRRIIFEKLGVVLMCELDIFLLFYFLNVYFLLLLK